MELMIKQMSIGFAGWIKDNYKYEKGKYRHLGDFYKNDKKLKSIEQLYEIFQKSDEYHQIIETHVHTPSNREALMSYIANLKGETDLIKSLSAQSAGVQEKILIELNNEVEETLKKYLQEINKHGK